MLEAAQQATDYVSSMTLETFKDDKRTQQAVIFNLMILGEATTKLCNKYPDMPEKYPDIAWNAMRGMRNHLVHAYFDINLEVVWNVTQSELPRLIAQLTRANNDFRGT
ncbi:DUF86 domain-containing protein [Ottowia sp. VDI28]|uniref:HepT-like ribonuclease domain-containing protein n=1 Tax=Ottowia sp. VDI28 TaxID=3133968 RepID=UPI003C2BAE10